MGLLSSISLLLLAGSTYTSAIQLDLTSDASIKTAASTIAFDMMSIYTGNRTGDTPGNLPDPYFWWECGAMFGAMVDYWYYTGDESYIPVTTQALLAQVGPDINYMPPNQSSTLGNDDQAFWGMAAMTAAEWNFPNPPDDQPQWLALAQAVFNSQIPRWENATCSGGLRWQIFPFNTGFDYKNTISNGALMNLGARLARYTGNDTYAQWAETAWEWMAKVNLINETDFSVVDGSHDLDGGCVTKTPIRWSYNVGILLHGAAHMYNYTNGDQKWRKRIQGLLDNSGIFFDQNQKDVMIESACETVNTCNTDQKSFKAYLSRWMGQTAVLAPFTNQFISQKLKGSAAAAAAKCSGGANQRTCSLRWTQGTATDAKVDVGVQMSALEVIQANLRDRKPGPVSQKKGGTSKGDPNAGTIKSTWSGVHESPITTADRAGAAILTIGLVAFICGGTAWTLLGS